MPIFLASKFSKVAANIDKFLGMKFAFKFTENFYHSYTIICHEFYSSFLLTSYTIIMAK